jgi:DNA ligase-associated metallophosphoesterase
MRTISLTVAGESLVLLPEHAIWWPARRTLLVADVHFGKAALFRAEGVPVPSGTTRTTLTRLDGLLQQWQATRLVFLGDLLHGRAGRSPRLFQQLMTWRSSWPALHLRLIRGNHDRHAGDPPAVLDVEVVDEPLLDGPFALCHEPDAAPGHFVLAGHWHPVMLLRGAGRQRLRLPCFCFEPERAILPAFGAFTGGWPVVPEPGRRLFTIGDGRVWPANL